MLQKKITYIMIPLVAFLISMFLFQVLLIQGSSMEPGYHNYQIVIINKTIKNFHRGDVVALRAPALQRTLIKRIVGIPKDTIDIKNGILYVNGIPDSRYFNISVSSENSATYTITLSDSEYFLLGDNLQNSIDSRFPSVGLVCDDDILGLIYPQN